jgi:hypothetical protein
MLGEVPVGGQQPGQRWWKLRIDQKPLSTLASYIHNAGAEAQLVVIVAGQELRYDLGRLGAVDDAVATTA